MSIEFLCSHCSQLLRVPDDSAGKPAKCPNCQQISDVPFQTAAPPIQQTDDANFKPNPFADPPIRTPDLTNPYQSPNSVADGVSTGPFTQAELATPGTRFLAMLIDLVASLVATIPGVAIFVIGAINESESTIIVGAVLITIGFMSVTIYNWVLTSKYGTTIGKRAMNIRIIRRSDRLPPGFVHGVVLRIWLPGLFGAITAGVCAVNLFFFIDSLFIFGEERRCVHDFMADTIVITN